MKKAITKQRAIIVFLALVFITGCNTNANVSITPTPAIIFTSTPKEEPTVSPTNTSIPTPIPTETAVIECSVPNGKWESNEKTGLLYKISPLLVFQVENCKIVFIEISAFPAPEELFWFPFENLDVSITDGNFTTTINNPIGGVGDLTIQGGFDTETTSQGTIQFPKGFSVVDNILNDDVGITWTASPIK